MPRNPGQPLGFKPQSVKPKPVPSYQAAFPGIQGEKDAEVGRRLERGLPADPQKRQQQIGSMRQKEHEWELKLEKMKAEDKAKSTSEITSISKFIKEVASKEQERQGEMRQRVKKIKEEKLGVSDKKKQRDQILSQLEEPSAKAKQGSFMSKMMQKGKGAMAEAKGALTKGGG